MMERVEPDKADRPLGMRPSEIGMLCQIVREFGCRRILEIGMANASSTVRLLQTLRDMGGGDVVSIDPFQYRDVPGVDEIYNIRGVGMENVKASGLESMHRLIADYDYVAMPDLVKNDEKFDMVFIDGYHSFDYTFIDFFYADLLLEDQGICAFHDTGYPAVNKVIQFVLKNKPYKTVGPAPVIYSPDFPSRVARRIWASMTGKAGEARERRTKWHALAAVQKLDTVISPQLTVTKF